MNTIDAFNFAVPNVYRVKTFATMLPGHKDINDYVGHGRKYL